LRMNRISIAGLRQGLGPGGLHAEDQSIWHRVRRNASISLLGSGLTVAIKLGQTVLLTKMLRIDDYGRVLIVVNLFVFLDSFIGLRVSDLMFRFFQPLKEQEETRALQGLLLLCVLISLASGLLISGGVFVLSPWLASRLYHSPEIAPLFVIYGFSVLVSTFTEVYEPILRIYDRFTSIVVPQVMGSLTTFAILIIYFATTDGYNLKIVVAAFTIGVLVQTLPPLVQALRLVRPFLSDFKAGSAMQALGKYRRELSRCLFNSNLSGYLKFAFSPGDLFLLGLFSSPQQVALYGLAKQLTAPLALLQTNIQTAITPEITSLSARGKLVQLKRLVSRFVASAFVLSSLLTLSAVLLGRLLIVPLSRPEYAAALPVFYALLIVAWLMLIFLVFRPLALSLDLLKWYNLALLASAAILFFVVVTGKLDALTMAYVQVAGALLLRVLFNMPVWVRLRELIVNSSAREES
jgi:O-antigen/teichoic acid export membrane protein